MTMLLRGWAIFVVAAKRLLSQKTLALATLLGLTIAIGLTVSIPLYTDAVYYSIFQEELRDLSSSSRGGRAPFTFMFRYVGSWQGRVSWEDVQQADEYFSNSAAAELDLPQEVFVRFFKTDNFRLFPAAEDLAYASTRDPLEWVSFGSISDLEDHITILEGRFPQPAEVSSDSVVEVMVSEALATELGIQVGEEYVAFLQQEIEDTRRTMQIPVQVVGVWQAIDEADPFWFYQPRSLDTLLVIPQETFINRIDPYMDNAIYLGLWYLIMDGGDVHASDAGTLLTRINKVVLTANTLLSGTDLGISPTNALQNYRRSAATLTILLYAFSVPILALILTFVNLVVGLAVGRKHNEIAVLRSRGGTIMQVVGISTLEGLILSGLALALALPLGEGIAYIIGQTRSFLNFTAATDLRLSITPATLRVGFVAVGVALVAQIVPTISAARHTIVTYKQERARTMRAPWWQRMWLDVMLLIPAAYGAYLIRQQGSIIMPGEEAMYNDPFQNPLLFLVPALGIFALTLLFIRILPLFMAFLAWIGSHIGGVGFLLATRQLSRTLGLYTAPMVLLVLTLSLSTFTATLAQTLDNHLYDQYFYEYGADVRVLEASETTENAFSMGGSGAQPTDAEAEEEEDAPRWLFLPVTEYLKADGVESAARIGEFKAATRLSGGNQYGQFLGVDRVDFAKTPFWRWDFSPKQFGELINAFAISDNGVLLPREFMRQHTLNVGDRIQVDATLYGERAEMDMIIVGGFDYFPTWYEEEDGPLFVGNLEHLFEQAGGQYPYRVWLRTTPGVDFKTIMEDIKALDFAVVDWQAPLLTVEKEQKSPERQGLFGLLSVGFGAAALFTILGFLLYAFFSFRQRFIELGVLRAIGLSSGQMTIFLAWELAFLILTGMALGTFLGVWVSYLFIPALQIGADPTALIPPFLVDIAWPAIFRIYALFGILFVVALTVLAILLLRMKIFEAIKLGETV